MNIFVSSSSPYASAVYLDDKRVVKMIVESMQLLSTVMSILAPAEYAALAEQNTPDVKYTYKPCYVNHPCAKWLRVDNRHIHWLMNHTSSLLLEYERRFFREHGSTPAFEGFVSSEFGKSIGQLSQPVESFLVCGGGAVHYPVAPAEAQGMYRDILAAKWKQDKRPPKWTGRLAPEWFVDSFAAAA